MRSFYDWLRGHPLVVDGVRILGKLGLRDRVQAVVFAYETGLVRARSRP